MLNAGDAITITKQSIKCTRSSAKAPGMELLFSRRRYVIWRWVWAWIVGLIVAVLISSSNSSGKYRPSFLSSFFSAPIAPSRNNNNNNNNNNKSVSSESSAAEEDLETTIISTTTTTTGKRKVRVDTQQLYASQEKLKDYEWEWILVKMNAVSNLPMEALGTDFPDPQVSLMVHANLPPNVDFSGPLNSFTWPTIWNYNEGSSSGEDKNPNGSSSSSATSRQVSSDWKGLGMAAYLTGTARSVDFIIWEKNQIDQDYLIFNQTVRIFPKLNQPDGDWTHQRLEQYDSSTGLNINMDISWKRMTTPLYTEADHDNMDLTEHLLTLENGELASIAYRRLATTTAAATTAAENKNKQKQHSKAVLYLAGRSDSFAHPHLLHMYFDDLGFDFYALDPRRAGRARRFMANPYLGNDVADFADELYEDVELALDFVHSQGNYDTVVAHCHSNGALTLISYLLEKRKRMAVAAAAAAAYPESAASLVPPSDFDGYILNSPFLDWGNVGGSFNEFLLKNVGIWNSLNTEATELYGHPGLNDWWTKIWLLYRWNLVWKPIFTNSLTSHYAQAASKVQWELLQLEQHLLPHHQPVLVLSSHADDILDHHETLRLAAEKVHPNPTLIELQWHSHDVTQSYTRELNNEALAAIVEWLDDLDTYRNVD